MKYFHSSANVYESKEAYSSSPSWSLTKSGIGTYGDASKLSTSVNCDIVTGWSMFVESMFPLVIVTPSGNRETLAVGDDRSNNVGESWDGVCRTLTMEGVVGDDRSEMLEEPGME